MQWKPWNPERPDRTDVLVKDSQYKQAFERWPRSSESSLWIVEIRSVIILNDIRKREWPHVCWHPDGMRLHTAWTHWRTHRKPVNTPRPKKKKKLQLPVRCLVFSANLTRRFKLGSWALDARVSKAHHLHYKRLHNISITFCFDTFLVLKVWTQTLMKIL